MMNIAVEFCLVLDFYRNLICELCEDEEVKQKVLKAIEESRCCENEVLKNLIEEC